MREQLYVPTSLRLDKDPSVSGAGRYVFLHHRAMINAAMILVYSMTQTQGRANVIGSGEFHISRPTSAVLKDMVLSPGARPLPTTG